PDQQCALPHRVHLKLLPSDGPPLELRLEIGNYVVNQMISADPQLFAMPSDAARQVDLSLLGSPSLVPPPSYEERYPAGQLPELSGDPGEASRPERSVYRPPTPPPTAMMQSYR